MYNDQMKYFIDCIKLDTPPMNSFEEALKVLEIGLAEVYEG